MNGDDLHQSILNKVSQDKFRLVLDIPPILKSVNTSNARANELISLDRVQFSHIGVDLPAHAISPISMPFDGQTMHVTSQVRSEYSAIKIPFVVDNMFNNYHLLFMWQEVLNNSIESGMNSHFNVLKYNGDKSTKFASNQNKDTPFELKHKQKTFKNSFFDYQTTITLYPLDEYERAVAKFVYTNAFITTLGGITYNFQQNEQIECFFEFAFGQMRMELLDVLKQDVT